MSRCSVFRAGLGNKRRGGGITPSKDCRDIYGGGDYIIVQGGGTFFSRSFCLRGLVMLKDMMIGDLVCPNTEFEAVVGIKRKKKLFES